ncbi:winged helix-turn-helix transcriptional regulator [Hoyosella rhizosphaerae]|uniref:Transcriptional regulator n=1 Tax=Hoyosella rhizosphaerae TaxID=1755582 RepID=A0A916XDD5_9ACTN|nr:metalloregulator ArsR/SmtB family transcription factor [Hoyosella rhizosphaerae]MBN4927567.1 winged helix-turn-helix transcriptional regulator [Hoyosella rhizosphaerae]GGC63450.1 transcriptional regulator [Hoyosella rhizosphaerae]
MTEPTLDDDRRIHEAGAAVACVPDLDYWALRFDLLSDANRLRILLAMHRAPGITVNGLAEALEMSSSAVSHALRLLRHHQWVRVQRDGRNMRYYLDDAVVHTILHSIGGTHAEPGHGDHDV